MEKIKWYNLNFFICILQPIDEKIQKEEAKKQAIEKLFRTMLSNLMSGKVRVSRVLRVRELRSYRVRKIESKGLRVYG